jgi:hypothetical protein
MQIIPDCYFVPLITVFFSYVLRAVWGEATITVHHHQEATGEEAAVQALEVTMEVVVGTSQLVFL